MKKIIFVSNRLPVTIEKDPVGGFVFHESIGGLATGLNSYHQDETIHTLWVGWCGLPDEELTEGEKTQLTADLFDSYDSYPVFLNENDIEQYYNGFCNNTIWPLFHYFLEYTEYNHDLWDAYKRVNQKFLNTLKNIIKPGDIVWVHDYQLMLLPNIIKQEFEDNQIGFFLHIPFPSFEIFRLLPWRNEILRGLLGSDLIGFHTYDYVRHFLSSVRRLLGFENNLGYIRYLNRLIKADIFPMGIDYEKYAHAGHNTEVKQFIKDFKKEVKDLRVILSIDRLDYTKGIPLRLKSYRLFLEKNPDYLEKVTLILVVAPSRIMVEQYQKIKDHIEILISDINGTFGTFYWQPIRFFYRTFVFEELTALYSISDVLLITPKRDGMNLIVKEYIATRTDYLGTLILSDTAGAASELGESYIINCNNEFEIANAIRDALELEKSEIIERNKILHARLKRYSISYWAVDFLRKLKDVIEYSLANSSRLLRARDKKIIIDKYKNSSNRLLFFDYDGTLIHFFDRPKKAFPQKSLLQLLTSFAGDSNNTIVIISGRDKNTLGNWLGDLDVNLIAGHGIWKKESGMEWSLIENLDNSWKDTIRPIFELYMDRTPLSIIEEKEYSISWHYRRCDPDLAFVRVTELKTALMDLTVNLDLSILDGNKVIEVKNTSINKGKAASLWLHHENWDFIYAAGDDWTDEDLFSVLPEDAVSIKIGSSFSKAEYYIDSVDEHLSFLSDLL